MPGSSKVPVLLCAAASLLLAACASTSPTGGVLERSADAAVSEETSATDAADQQAIAAPATTTTVPAPPAPEPPATEPPPTTRPHIERVLVETGFSPYAIAEGVTLHHPASIVERIGFHEAGHDGARQQDPVEGAARPFVMESRERGTTDRSAADIVVQPDSELRAPVTGTVLRGGGYTLYCDKTDEYLVIEPDGRPGWEVKLLHFEGLQVSVGDRVEAGVTVVALRGRILPFESQVDEFTAAPAWPHVHVEVVDTSIPDKPSGGGGC